MRTFHKISFYCFFITIVISAACSKKAYQVKNTREDSWARASKEIENTQYKNLKESLGQQGDVHPDSSNQKIIKSDLETPDNITFRPVVPSQTARERYISLPLDTIIDKPVKELNKKGRDGFIFSLLSFLPIPLVNMVFSVLGIIFGFKALSEFEKSPGKFKGKGLAISAICIGFFTIFITIAIILLFILLISALSDW